MSQKYKKKMFMVQKLYRCSVSFFIIFHALMQTFYSNWKYRKSWMNSCGKYGCLQVHSINIWISNIKKLYFRWHCQTKSHFPFFNPKQCYPWCPCWWWNLELFTTRLRAHPFIVNLNLTQHTFNIFWQGQADRAVTLNIFHHLYQWHFSGAEMSH